VRAVEVRWRVEWRRVSVARRVVLKLVQRRRVEDCSRREMGGRAVLLARC